MFKNQKGITLVALVITIIVLLILAGVAITLAVDQGELFNHANNAVTEWNNKVNQEGEAINNALNYLNTHTP